MKYYFLAGATSLVEAADFSKALLSNKGLAAGRDGYIYLFYGSETALYKSNYGDYARKHGFSEVAVYEIERKGISASIEKFAGVEFDLNNRKVKQALIKLKHVSFLKRYRIRPEECGIKITPAGRIVETKPHGPDYLNSYEPFEL